MITDKEVWQEMKEQGLPTQNADPVYWGIQDSFIAVKEQLEAQELVESNEQVRALLEGLDVSLEDAIKISVKLHEDDDIEPLNIEERPFELYYKDFTITHHGSWFFDDNTKDMNYWDVDLLNGMLVADKIREQGL